MKINKVFTFLIGLIIIGGLLPALTIAKERGSSKINPMRNNINASEVAMTSPPPLYELELTSLYGEVFINPVYTGKINSVRALDRNQLLGKKVDIKTRTLTDSWKKLNVPSSLSDAFGLVVSGKEGILKITLPQNTTGSSGSGVLRSVGSLLIEFGSLNATFTFPEVNILEPSRYQIGILNTADNTFINGDIIVLKNNQAAVEFGNLPASVVNKDGMIRVSLKKSDGTFINSDLPAWGYNIIVSETDTGVPAPITAQVFGLPDDEEIKFNFVSLTGQVINPSMKTLTVGEINKGTQISTITTNIEGPQPITVTVTIK